MLDTDRSLEILGGQRIPKERTDHRRRFHECAVRFERGATGVVSPGACGRDLRAGTVTADAPLRSGGSSPTIPWIGPAIA